MKQNRTFTAAAVAWVEIRALRTTLILTALLTTPARADDTSQADRALTSAISRGGHGTDRDAIQAALRRGADPNKIGGERQTPLTQAIVDGKVEAVGLLLKAGADANLAPPKGTCPLVTAIDTSTRGFPGEHRQAVVTLLLGAGADPNGRTCTRDAPVAAAVAHQEPDILQMLIKAGAKPAAESKSGRAPLLIAAYHSDSATISTLLAAGDDPNVIGPNGDTPLRVATGRRCSPCALALLKAGAAFEVADRRWFDIIGRADGDVIAGYLARGVDPNTHGPYGQTLLHIAAQDGKADGVKALLEAHAEPNPRNTMGDTPLILAARKGNIEAVNALLSGKADPMLRGRDGATAKEVAAAAGQTRVLAALKAAGVPGYEGPRPLEASELAAMCGDAFKDYWGQGRNAIRRQCGTVFRTADVAKAVPAVRSDALFWRLYPNANPGHGEPGRLLAALTDQKAVLVASTADFAPFVKEVASGEEAQALVRFLTSGAYQLDDVGRGGYAELGKDVEVVGAAPKSLKYKTSTVVRHGRTFVIKRTVVTPAEIDAGHQLTVRERPKMAHERQIKLDKVSVATETVDREGHVTIKLEEVPAEGLVVAQRIFFID